MRVRIPYTFTAHVVPLRKLKPISSTEGDWLTADITEIDEIDAPIATAWTDYKGDTFQTRWHNGSHWQIHKIYDRDGNYQGVLTPSKLTDMFESGDSSNPLSVGTTSSLQQLVSGEIQSFQRQNFKDVIKTEQEAVLLRIQDQINDCIIVDDEIWTKCTEPYYRYIQHYVKKLDDGRAIRYPEVGLIPVDEEVYRAYETFNANEFEEFVALATGGFQEIIVPEQLKITVLIPESINFNSHQSALYSSSKSFLTGTQGVLGKRSSDFIHCWADLRDALEKAMTDKSEGNDDRLVSALTAIVEVAPDKSEYEINNISKMVERWESRNIPIDFHII
jgi:hypothetical protein